jgi:hypothetical protein
MGMQRHMIKNIVSVAAAVLAAGVLVVGCHFDQPEAGCIVQDTTWYAKYDLKTDPAVPVGCESSVLTSEQLGVFKFTNPDVPGEVKLTIRPYGLASRGARDPSDPAEQTAVGALSDEPVENFCTAAEFAEASVKAAPQADDPETHRNEAEAGMNISYTFENVRVYSAPQAPGTQLKADLTYTANGCTTKYAVRAIWPAAGCEPGDEEACGEGSGVNPDFHAECAPNPLYDEEAVADEEEGKVVPAEFTTPGYCVPVGDIPAFD